MDIADVRWPASFTRSLTQDPAWQQQPDNVWRYSGDLGVLTGPDRPVLPSADPMGWADGHGLIVDVTFEYLAASYTFTIQSGYTVLAFTVTAYPVAVDPATGHSAGTRIRWSSYHATPAELEFGQGTHAGGTVDVALTARLRVRRAGAVAVAEWDNGGGWQHLFTTGDLNDFMAGPDGWYLYSYDIWGGTRWRSVAGYPQSESTLYQCQPDGTLALVGTAEQPFAQTLPDGTVRVWPGAEQPLYQCQPDGTLAKVIG